jgi:uncharacterized protein (TIGR03118 family)
MSVTFPQVQEQGNQGDSADPFSQTNLVSDGSVPAANIDPNLINPWGIASSAQGPFWIADNGSGVATVYDGAGTPQTVLGQSSIAIATPPGAMAMPPGQTTPASPTGEVFNFTQQGFDISSGGKTGSSAFLFATEDGTISGWSPEVNAGSSVIAVDNSMGGTGAVYKGLAIGQTGGETFLYASNFRNGTVDVFNNNFQQVNSFTDPNLPTGYAPFNVQVLDGNLFVTFALQDAQKQDDVSGAGNGFVDEFDLQGNLLHRVASQGVLNSPWGLAIAPSGFGEFSNDLLVGNFGDGTINAFDPKTDQFLGQLSDANGKPIQIGDLWSLVPGNGSSNSDPHKIYFTAGVENEQHGLFGSLGAVGDPDQTTISLAGVNHSVG